MRYFFIICPALAEIIFIICLALDEILFVICLALDDIFLLFVDSFILPAVACY